MGDKAWKVAERKAAAVIGGLRQGPRTRSGSKQTTGDIIHPRVYVEVKYRQSFATCSLHRENRAKATKESKVAVTVLQEAGAKSRVWCVDERDLYEFAAEVLAAALDGDQTDAN